MAVDGRGVDAFTDYYDPAIKRRNLEAAQQHPNFEFVAADLGAAANATRFQRGASDGAGQRTAARSMNGARVPPACGSFSVVMAILS